MERRKNLKTLLLSCCYLMTAALMSFHTLAQNSKQDPNSSVQVSSEQCPSYLKGPIKKLNSSETVNLCELTQGKVLLIVNTASNCGFTPQFKALEQVHQRYQEQGLVVLGFPSDDFFQEEAKQEKIADVCFVNYGVSFTMLEPVNVWGRNANTIFRHLAEKSTSPKWNFYKYIVSENGEQVKAFNSKVKPTSATLIEALEQALNNQGINKKVAI